MLQKSEKGVYNRLSRRQVLKTLGTAGMGLIAVGSVSGCTTKLFEPLGKIDQTGSSTPLAASALFPRTYRAMEGLNQRYLSEKSQQLKTIAKSLRKRKDNPTILASEAHRISHEIIDHWSATRVLLALDQDLQELLLTKPELLHLPLPGTERKVRSLQIELGLTDDDIKGWEEKSKWDKARLLKIIQRKGSEYVWRHWLNRTFGFKSAQPQQIFVPLGPVVLVVIGIILVLVATACETGICTDPSGTFPSPPVPPPPPDEGGCFVKGTLVATARGPRPIEQIQAGDDVYAFDLILEDVAARKVVKTFEVRGDEILLLDFDVEQIRCTPLHKFYTGQWVYAGELKRGDRVLALDGRWKDLKWIHREIKPQSVFNLHTEGTNNYFVGQAGVLAYKE